MRISDWSSDVCSSDLLPRRSGLPRWNESTGPEALYQDVRAALGGTIVREVRGTEHGGLFLSVAVPVQRYKQVLGALMLSVEGEDIDAAVREVRFEKLGRASCRERVCPYV